MDYDKIVRMQMAVSAKSILSVKKYSGERVVDGISDVQFIVRGVENYDECDVVRLQIIDRRTFCVLFLNEANRFLLASLVSFRRATQIEPDNVSWQIIEFYYAAYFAAHYLIRTSGISIANIDSIFISKVNNNVGAIRQYNLQTGIYEISYDERYDNLFLLKSKRKKPGGSHRELWDQWSQYLSRLIKYADNDILEYAHEAKFLLSHQKFISNSGYYTPKELRGEVNYQFKHNAWIFNDHRRRNVKTLNTCLLDLESIYPKFDNDIKSLIFNSYFMVKLASAFFIEVVEKLPVGYSSIMFHKYKELFSIN